MESNPTVIQCLTRELNRVWDYYHQSWKQGSPQIILDAIEDYQNRIQKAIDLIENGDPLSPILGSGE